MKTPEEIGSDIVFFYRRSITDDRQNMIDAIVAAIREAVKEQLDASVKVAEDIARRADDADSENYPHYASAGTWTQMIVDSLKEQKP